LSQAAGLSQTRENLGQSLATDYGLAMATAEQSWLDHMLGEMTE
jgi:hypothetical protein